MGKHSKNEDYNSKPFDEAADAATKAREFDEQYGQNRTYTVSPALDALRKEQDKK